jgi:hypothetical protein
LSGGRGQASVELVAATVVVLLAGLVGFQLLAAGYAAVMADHAAEAAALAVANGREPERAAVRALPAWPQRALSVERHGGHVRVRLVPPSPLRFLRGRLSVSADATVRPRASSAGTPAWQSRPAGSRDR